MNSSCKPRAAAPRSFGDIETWVFDLDNTLYSHHLNLWQQVDERIRDYISNFLKVSARRRVPAAEGLLQALRHLDARDDDRARHEPGRLISISCTRSTTRRWSPMPTLGAAIEKLPGRKLILTNGTRKHADAVMERLAIDHHFEDVFDIIAAELEPKPSPQTYDRFLARHNVDPKKAAMFEDLARNSQRAACARHDHRAGGAGRHPRSLPRALGAGRPRRRACRSRHRRSRGLSGCSYSGENRPFLTSPPLPRDTQSR